MTVRSDITVDFARSPRIITVAAPSTELTIQDLVDTLRNIEADIQNIDNDMLIKASGKEDLGGGVTVGITAELQNAKVAFEGRFAPITTGTATQDDSDGKILTDSSAHFITDGVYVGCTVWNDTTNSMGVITEVVSETQIRHTQLSGGSGTSWTSSDLYSVYPNVQCKITGGNLIAVDTDGNSMSPILPSANVQIVITSSSSATLQELDAIRYSSYQNAVWLDNINGMSGVNYPSGTREYPVNNLADAVTIADDKGFDTIRVLQDMTIDSGADIRDFVLKGKSSTNTQIVIATSAMCENITIETCTISGTLDGGTVIRNCVVGSINYVNGHIHESGLNGNIVLAGSKDAVLDGCFSVDVNSVPVIDMGGSGQDVVIVDYSGDIILKNLTGSNKALLQLDGGKATLDSTITAGTVTVSGIGVLVNNSTATVNLDGFINRETIAQSIWSSNEASYIGTSGMGGAILRGLGLLQENHYLDNTSYTTYNGQKLMTEGRIRIYSNSASVGTDCGCVASYIITASWNNDELDTYKVVKSG